MGKARAESILARYCEAGGATFRALTLHGEAIWGKIREILARTYLGPVDAALLEEAAYLHDIGAVRTSLPEIGCKGEAPYLMHGVFGREILEAEGLPRHARIAECHIGVGLTVADIDKMGVPLPRRDAVPETLEEVLVCFADLFFSKHPGKESVPKSAAQVRRKLARYGDRQVIVFDRWCAQFKEAREE